MLPLAGGSALSRDTFDAALIRSAIARGADFLPSTSASLGQSLPDLRLLRLQRECHEAEVSARVILAADGLGSMLLSKAGIAQSPAQTGSRMGAGIVIDHDESFYQPGMVFMTCGTAGYVGLVRLEDGRLDIACAFDSAAVRAAGGPGKLASDLLGEAHWPVPPDLERLHWRGTAPLTRQARRIADHRLFALGDATGYVEPFTGEGIAWALASAIALAPLALQAARNWQPRLALAWTESHRHIVRRRQLAVRLLAGVLRRPRLTTALVSVLRAARALPSP